MSMYDVSLLNSLNKTKHDLPTNWTVRPLQLSDYNKGEYGLSLWWRGLGLLKKVDSVQLLSPYMKAIKLKKSFKG